MSLLRAKSGNGKSGKLSGFLPQGCISTGGSDRARLPLTQQAADKLWLFESRKKLSTNGGMRDA